MKMCQLKKTRFPHKGTTFNAYITRTIVFSNSHIRCAKGAQCAFLTNMNVHLTNVTHTHFRLPINVEKKKEIEKLNFSRWRYWLVLVVPIMVACGLTFTQYFLHACLGTVWPGKQIDIDTWPGLEVSIFSNTTKWMRTFEQKHEYWEDKDENFYQRIYSPSNLCPCIYNSYMGTFMGNVCDWTYTTKKNQPGLPSEHFLLENTHMMYTFTNFCFSPYIYCIFIESKVCTMYVMSQP